MRFVVRNRQIRYIYENIKIGDNADYVATFELDDEWTGHTVTARFINGDKMIERVLDGNSCSIPVEILKKGKLRVGVYTDEMTTTPCELWITESIKQYGGTTPAPSDDVYAQILGKVDRCEEVANDLEQKAESGYFNGKDGKDGKDGANGLDGKDGVDGVSPTLSVAETTGGHRVSITDVNGTQTFDVMNGVDGKNGKDGIDGKDGKDGKEYDDTEIREDISDINNNLSKEVSDRKSADALLRSRVDALASLQEGSTTGDAELQDIRVKADGTTATTAGNAVREQVSELKGDISDFVDITNSDIVGDYGYFIEWETGRKIANESGNPYAVENIPVYGNSKIKVTITATPVAVVRGFAFYDVNHKYISGVGLTVNQHDYELVVPENGVWLSFTYFGAGAYRLRYTEFYKSIGKDVLKIVSKNVDSNANDNPLNNIIKDYGFTKIFTTIGVVGDSLSSGEMEYTSSVDGSTKFKDMYDYSWLQYMARGCGTKGYNFSQGGLSTKDFMEDVGGRLSDMRNSDKKCKAYFIALGHNDYKQRLPVGSLSDRYTSNQTYFKYYIDIIAEIRNIDSHAQIFCITMKSDAYSTYNDAIRQIVRYFRSDGVTNIHLIDMYNYGNNVNDWEFTGGHGNALGYLYYSYQIGTYVDWIIKNNFSEFKMVQFIGRDDLPVNW